MNKSLMATFIGQQIDRARLSLDDSVTEALKTAGSDASLRWGTRQPGESRSYAGALAVQRRHMTSGFDFAERYFPGDDVTDMLYRQPGMWLSAPATGHARPPGEQFAYSSGDINTASHVATVSRGAGLPGLDRRPLQHRPLGMQEMVLEPDASGIQVGSSYAYQRLPPAQTVLRAPPRLGADGATVAGCLAWPCVAQSSAKTGSGWRSRRVRANNGEIYGLGFWLNTGHRAFPNAPESTFHAGGNSQMGSLCLAVLPERSWWLFGSDSLSVRVSAGRIKGSYLLDAGRHVTG